MNFTKITVLLVLALCSVIYAQTGINTGEGLQSLFFPGNGGVELATSQNRSTLADNLPLSFTFEAWIMLPNPPADGFYKSIVARWDIGPDRTFHNRYADFDFQVQASGTLNFFMGNGGPSIYGILRGTTTLNQGQWTHVAFSVNHPDPANPPTSATVYYDLTSWDATWTTGSRQLPAASRNRNIYLGDYFNQDGDNKYWRGYMDEVRFWAGVRSQSDIQRYLRRVVPVSSVGLLAYYRFNEGAGLLLSDSTDNKFDGRLSRTTANTSSPVWRPSGVKIDVDVKVNPLEIATVFLPGFSPTGSLSFTYAIDSLPEQGNSGAVGRLLADGQFITTTPFALQKGSNQVSFEAPNVTGVEVTFRYFGTHNIMDPSSREDEATTVYVQIGDAPCIPDACGKCGGDNSTCTCLPLPYNGYNLHDIERILLLYEIEQTLDLLNQLEGKIDTTIKTLQQHQATELQLVIDQTTVFNNKCLVDFCSKIDKYMDALAAIGPQ